MRVQVNGEDTLLPEGTTVAALAAELGLTARRGVAVAVDGEVVPGARWGDAELTEGARVEIVHAVQGGA